MNQVRIRVYGHGGFEHEGEYEVGIDPSTTLNPDELLVWGLHRYDDVGLYFAYPDMAKHISMDLMDEDWRADRAVFDVASLNGYQRGCLKKKPEQPEKKRIDFLKRRKFQ